MLSQTTSGDSMLAVDSHVHIHDLTDPAALFETTLRTFKNTLGLSASQQAFVGMLILTEPQTRQSFPNLLGLIPQDRTALSLPGWNLERTGEDISLRAVHSSGDMLFLLAGQQIVTEDKLEVLSLLTRRLIPDNLGLRETIQQILQVGGLPVLPWGIGKWLGRRGKIVSEFLENPRETPIFLGDNGGRPSFWRSIPQFRQAEKRGIGILRGSDPLRCSFNRRPAGSFGNLLPCQVDQAHPGQSLRQALLADTLNLGVFGDLEHPLNFFRDQLALRIS